MNLREAVWLRYVLIALVAIAYGLGLNQPYAARDTLAHITFRVMITVVAFCVLPLGYLIWPSANGQPFPMKRYFLALTAFGIVEFVFNLEQSRVWAWVANHDSLERAAAFSASPVGVWLVPLGLLGIFWIVVARRS